MRPPVYGPHSSLQLLGGLGRSGGAEGNADPAWFVRVAGLVHEGAAGNSSAGVGRQSCRCAERPRVMSRRWPETLSSLETLNPTW